MLTSYILHDAYVYISVYLSIYLSTYLSIYLPIYLSIYLNIYMYIYIYTYVQIHTHIYIYICLVSISISVSGEWVMYDIWYDMKKYIFEYRHYYFLYKVHTHWLLGSIRFFSTSNWHARTSDVFFPHLNCSGLFDKRGGKDGCSWLHYELGLAGCILTAFGWGFCGINLTCVHNMYTHGIYTYIHTHIYIFNHLYINIHIFTCGHMCIYIYVYT